MANKSMKRVNSRADRYVRDTYEEGSAVRKIAYIPQEEVREQLPKHKVSNQTNRNRQRATQMNRGYVVFLAAVCIATVLVCVNFLQLKAQVTTQNENVASLETKLSELKADNDAYYNTVMASVSMDTVKEVALTRLGLSYADESQVQYYDATGNSYVRQYAEVPTAE